MKWNIVHYLYSLVQAQYWHNPLDEEAYKAKNIFLPDANNENTMNEQYKQRLMSLNKFVMVKFNQDKMVQPIESEVSETFSLILFCVTITVDLVMSVCHTKLAPLPHSAVPSILNYNSTCGFGQAYRLGRLTFFFWSKIITTEIMWSKITWIFLKTWRKMF